ncbi:hypothetical protein [Hyalangium minutum]|uniref:hypothetical protein n=1 Tax=Hyalangium minutum TaxID=394096 RepID=UPI0012FC0478|nr:hypothetical protein [Hyalangium minutum]
MPRLGLKWMPVGLLLGSAAASVGCGGPPPDAVATEVSEPGEAPLERSAFSTCTYSIWGWGLKVLRDQRTNIINYEGDLELQVRYHANGVSLPRYPEPSEGVSYYKVAYPEHYNRPGHITDVVSSVEAPVTITLTAEVWEIENGLQGGTDYGTASIPLTLNCIDTAIEGNVNVSVPGDNSKEKTALVQVWIDAVK